MDENRQFQDDVKAALAPNRTGLACNFGTSAPGSGVCKDTKCGKSALFLFSGYCASCAPKHNIDLLTVGPQAIEPEQPTQPDKAAST